MCPLSSEVFVTSSKRWVRLKNSNKKDKKEDYKTEFAIVSVYDYLKANTAL